MNWHWEFCPICQASGAVSVYVGGTWNSATLTYRRCDACDGVGRIKVPNGYHLHASEPPLSTLTVSSSSAITLEVRQ